MSVQLLDNTRRINKLVQTSGRRRVQFKDICEVLSGILSANVLIFSSKGKILAGYKRQDVAAISGMVEGEPGDYIDRQLHERLLGILSTKENVNMATLGFDGGDSGGASSGMAVPIDMAGERLGTLFLYRDEKLFDIDDIILGEYGATVVGLEIMRAVYEESAEEARKASVVKAALTTLSFSEKEAVIHIFEELEGTEGILVASKVADRMGITRSVIVNALRKLESAGVIESRSLGMKGTYIKTMNEYLFGELESNSRKP